ncbi:MAG: spore germination protein [Pelosinus sp.]|nr:spore germination protein [Pelosinus sp.]
MNKKRKLQKLSVLVPEASLALTKKRLQELEKLTSESSTLANSLGAIVQKLRMPIKSSGHIFPTIDHNFNFLIQSLGTDSGLIQKKYSIGAANTQIGVAYIESITDIELISTQVITPLLQRNIQKKTAAKLLEEIQSKFIAALDVKTAFFNKEIPTALLNGTTVLFLDGVSSALLISSRKIEKRPISVPNNEGTTLSSQESFTEDLNTNCSMLIRRLPTEALRFEAFTVGTLSQTKSKLVWLEGITNPYLIDEARRRLNRIDIDIVDGIGALGGLISDNPFSLFPKYKQTQRPDVVALSLTQGKFAILCNNSPFAFSAPTGFWDNFKTMDDYAEQTINASYLRLARILAFFISIFISPLYLAFVTYNQIIVPPNLAANITVGRLGVPFPSAVELLLMTFIITIIREAALRIPGTVSYFVGSLAAVVLGQAVVSAGYISASIIIIVAVSEIAAFAVSSTNLVSTSRLLNYLLILLSGIFGMFGLINGIVIICWHVVSLKSFGVPYVYPIIPFDSSTIRDVFTRLGITTNRLRILAPFNRKKSSTK